MSSEPTPISGPLLAAIRRECDAASQRKVAERIGMTHAKLSRLLAGKGTITLETADRVAAVLGVRAT